MTSEYAGFLGHFTSGFGVSGDRRIFAAAYGILAGRPLIGIATSSAWRAAFGEGIEPAGLVFEEHIRTMLAMLCQGNLQLQGSLELSKRATRALKQEQMRQRPPPYDASNLPVCTVCMTPFSTVASLHKHLESAGHFVLNHTTGDGYTRATDPSFIAHLQGIFIGWKDPVQTDAFQWAIQGSNTLLLGSAGCGKSFTSYLIALWQTLTLGPDFVAITGTTGAAARVAGSRGLSSATVHHWGYLGVFDYYYSVEDIVKRIRNSEEKLQRWLSVRSLFLEEVVNFSAAQLDKLSRVAQLVRGNVAPFGGIQVIFSGSCTQLAAFATRKEGQEMYSAADEAPIFMARCFSELFALDSIFYLDTPHRIAGGDAAADSLALEAKAIFERLQFGVATPADYRRMADTAVFGPEAIRQCSAVERNPELVAELVEARAREDAWTRSPDSTTVARLELLASTTVAPGSSSSKGVVAPVARARMVLDVPASTTVAPGSSSSKGVVAPVARPHMALDVPLTIVWTKRESRSGNHTLLFKIPGPAYRLPAMDSYGGVAVGVHKGEWCGAADCVLLKEGARVAVTRNGVGNNDDTVNGDLGDVLRITVVPAGAVPSVDNTTVRVRFLDGRVQDITAFDFQGPGINGTSRRAMPLRLAWFLTPNLSQGMSVKYVRVLLPKGVRPFGAGSAYTAVLRGMSVAGTLIIGLTREWTVVCPLSLQFTLLIMKAKAPEAFLRYQRDAAAFLTGLGDSAVVDWKYERDAAVKVAQSVLEMLPLRAGAINARGSHWRDQLRHAFTGAWRREGVHAALSSRDGLPSALPASLRTIFDQQHTLGPCLDAFLASAVPEHPPSDDGVSDGNNMASASNAEEEEFGAGSADPFGVLAEGACNGTSAAETSNWFEGEEVFSAVDAFAARVAGSASLPVPKPTRIISATSLHLPSGQCSITASPLVVPSFSAASRPTGTESWGLPPSRREPPPADFSSSTVFGEGAAILPARRGRHTGAHRMSSLSGHKRGHDGTSAQLGDAVKPKRPRYASKDAGEYPRTGGTNDASLVSGDGGFVVSLPPGTAALLLEQPSRKMVAGSTIGSSVPF